MATSQDDASHAAKASPFVARKQGVSSVLPSNRLLKHHLLLLQREASFSTESLNTGSSNANDSDRLTDKAPLLRKKPSSLKVRRPVTTADCASSQQGAAPVAKKVVSFSSTPREKSKKIIDAPDCIRCMCEGSAMTKVCPGGRQYRRTYFLDPDAQALRWYPSAKKRHKACILLDHIMEVRNGRAALQTFHENAANCGSCSGGGGSMGLGMVSLASNSGAGGSLPCNSSLSSSLPMSESVDEGTALLIVHGSQFKYLHLVAKTPEEAQIWFTGLSCLIYGKVQPHDPSDDKVAMRDRWLQEVFSEADSEKKGFLDEADVVRLLQRLNTRHNVKESDLKRSTTKGRVTSEQFISIFKEVFTRPEIYFLLVKYSSSGEYFSVDDLLLFLTAEQGMSATSREQCSLIIQQFEPSSEGKQKEQLGIDGFTAFLQSAQCDVLDPNCTRIWQDMNQPLTHYFIAASHRTYLMEDQLKGPSSVEGYRMALEGGCRYLEVECWDGPNNEPIVYHGKTLTSSIAFNDVMQVISEGAFQHSEFPLIVSLNVHCSLSQQRHLVSALQLHLGKWIFTQHDWLLWRENKLSKSPTNTKLPLIDTDSQLFAMSSNTSSSSLSSSEFSSNLPPNTTAEDTVSLTASLWPSPWDLRGRILIKGKCLGELASPLGATEACGYVTEEDEDVPEKLTPWKPVSGGSPNNATSISNLATEGLGEGGNERVLKMLGALSDVVSVLPSRRFRERHLMSASPVSLLASRSHQGGATGPLLSPTSLSPGMGPASRRPHHHGTPTSPTNAHLLSTDPSSLSATSSSFFPPSASPKHTPLSARTSPRGVRPLPDQLGVYNMSETSAFRLANTKPEELVQFCKQHLLRVFPCPSRVDSSNFYPQELWNCGCQLLCLNYQSPGLMLDLQRAMFSRNGNCGYCLKPSIMRQPMAYYKLDGSTFPDAEPVLLNIRIISGLNLPKPRASVSRSNVVEPFVLVEVFGLPSDCATVDDSGGGSATGAGPGPGEQRTRTVTCEQDHYALFDDSFEFEINMPEMALVRFLVLDDDSIGDEFIGQATLPLDCMKKGYRHIQLKNQIGDDIADAYLFVQVCITNKPAGLAKPQHMGRVLSLKRRKLKRDYPQVKKVGFAPVDEIFKSSIVCIHEAADLRLHLQDMLNEFRSQCGASSIANIRQCMHSLCQRLGSAALPSTPGATSPVLPSSDVPSSTTPPSRRVNFQDVPGTNCELTPSCTLGSTALQLTVRDGDHLPNLTVAADITLPEALRRCCPVYMNLVNDCKNIIEEAEAVAEQLQHKHDEAVLRYEALSQHCIEQRQKTRKAARAMESYVWNVRLLAGQREALRKARQEAGNYLIESMEAGLTLGMTSSAMVESVQTAVHLLIMSTGSSSSVAVPPPN